MDALTVLQKRVSSAILEAPAPTENQLSEMFKAALRAPDHGALTPWRFLTIRNLSRREKIYQIVDEERLKTGSLLGARQTEFLKLKVEGILDCAELVVAALPEGREAHVFGRRTLPEMDLASLACAIQNIWLAARAEGIGMGWVSMFDPDALKDVLKMPMGSLPVAILCFGQVDQFYPKPMLEMTGWADPQSISEFLYEEEWET